MADINKYVGYGLTTLAYHFLNKRSNSADEQKEEPADLNVQQNESKIGYAIPVVLGRALIKSPAVAYYGDFSYRPYTETYSAHAHFNAWPLVLSLIMAYIANPTPITVLPGQKVQTAGGPGATSVPGQGKDTFIGKLLWSLFVWLLNWLINGRNLKTTIQKGFKYYLGYQYLVSWSGLNMRVRKVYLAEEQVWEGDVTRLGLATDGVSVAVTGGMPKADLEDAVQKFKDDPNPDKGILKDYIEKLKEAKREQIPKSPNASHMLDIDVDAENLFGGVDENGGFIGNIHVYLGGEYQEPDPWMVKEMNSPSIQPSLRGLTPAYKPFVSIVVPTAYIGKQSTIPKLWIELQNCPNNLGLGAIGEDANPAEVIYEIITNNDWGLAESPESIDLEALIELGSICDTEGIGISVLLNQTQKAQDVLDNICAHINAVRYADPHTGKTVFRLIRDDYNLAYCLSLDMHNVSQLSFTRLDWSQIISKVSVSFTSATNKYEVATVPTQDPAAIEIAKGVQTVKSYDYTYFTEPKNAVWAAKRELQAQAYPLATVSITGNRDLFEVRIGDVILLNWKPYGIKDLPIRITNVDISELTDGKIQLDGIEDVWGLAHTTYTYSDGTAILPEDRYPEGVEHYQFMEMPFELSSDRRTQVVAFAARPDKYTELWNVWRKPYEQAFKETSTLSKWTPAGLLVHGLPEEGDVEDVDGFTISELYGLSGLPYTDVEDFEVSREGVQLVLIEDELIAFSGLRQLPNGNWQVLGVLRGVFDTVPAKHPLDTPVFFIESGMYQSVTGGKGCVCEEGKTTTEYYNITTATKKHVEAFDDAKTVDLKTTCRSILPTVPGHIRLSDRFHTDERRLSKVGGDLSISFVERNGHLFSGAVSQDDVEYKGGVPFETEEGVDYYLEVDNSEELAGFDYTESPVVLKWEDVCLGFQHIEPPVEFIVRLYARKEGRLSYQPQTRKFIYTVPTIVGVVANKAEAEAKLKAEGTPDHIRIFENDPTKTRQIHYVDLPIFIVGTRDSNGLLYNEDGATYIGTGDIFIAKDDATLEAYQMQDGYAFTSYFDPNSTDPIILEWYNGQIQERER